VKALAAAAAGLVLGSAGLAAAQWRRLTAARRACAAAPPAYARPIAGAPRRIVLLGDSTGVGLGCEPARESIAARLARDFPEACITNLCVSGARMADTLRQARQLPPGEIDLVLVLAGGNDVMRFTGWPALEADTRALLAALQPRTRHLVWTGMPNLGLAPLFLPPFSWVLSARARRAQRLFARCAHEAGARFVDFFRDAPADPFSAEPLRYYAADRIHPSAEAYGWCYRRMRPVLAHALSR
jgi:lysophospholipase L1-like esterase